MSLFKINENCNGCLACVQNCPAGALNYIDEKKSRQLLHNISLCARCGHCWRICPENAIEFKYLLTGKFELAKTLDLIHCKVCGTAICTQNLGDTAFQKTGQDIEALCPDHKGSDPINIWKKLAAGRISQ